MIRSAATKPQATRDTTPCHADAGRAGIGRELQVVTVTDFATPDAGKKTVWLQARDHAWESPTSFIMEGALKFIFTGGATVRIVGPAVDLHAAGQSLRVLVVVLCVPAAFKYLLGEGAPVLPAAAASIGSAQSVVTLGPGRNALGACFSPR